MKASRPRIRETPALPDGIEMIEAIGEDAEAEAGAQTGDRRGSLRDRLIPGRRTETRTNPGQCHRLDLDRKDS